MEMKQGGTLEE